MNEPNQFQVHAAAPRSRRTAPMDGDDEDSENDSDYNSDSRSSQDGDEQRDGNESEEEWDYDRLLELGQVLGDVKTERWRMRAQKVIRSLPTIHYRDIVKQHAEQEKMASSAAISSEQADERAAAAAVTTIGISGCNGWFHPDCVDYSPLSREQLNA
eukprot:gene22018-28112_t